MECDLASQKMKLDNSLTNVDYRILRQDLVNQLHKVLPTLISQNQAGYVKGRYIGNNIRAIEDLILYAEKENVNSIICFWIFKKHSIL